jgi:hypothetical protein
MNNIAIVEGPEVTQKEIPEEGKYFEVIWSLNASPEEAWDKEFEKQIKKYLEIENPLFGPYKPKIIFSELILTLLDEKRIEEQKEYYEKEFIEKVNSKIFS